MSTTNRSNRRGTILDEIMTYHREQLPKTIREMPLADLRAFTVVAPEPLDFYAALKQYGVSLIAECKKASPSKGLIAPKYDPVGLAKMYIEAGASAISVLTDKRFFQGSLEDLRDVKESTTYKQVPVLRKDFIFDPYQVYEARVAGADGILLIASVLGSTVLKDLMDLSRELGMEPLVEVHAQEELERVLPLGPRIIGVNNRDLQTFKVDFENTARLRKMIPAEIAVVGESGVRSVEDVGRMVEIGVDAILVGESLVKDKNPLELARSFVKAGRP